MHPLLQIFPAAVCAVAVLLVVPELTLMLGASIRRGNYWQAAGQAAAVTLAVVGLAVTVASIATWLWGEMM
jgi:hypothetical protein